jgi:hypothetical protein
MRITDLMKPNLTQPNLSFTCDIRLCALDNANKDFNEIWYGRYATGDNSILTLHNFPHSTKTKITVA